MNVIENHGPAAVQRGYLDTLNGRVPPDQGLILSLIGIGDISSRPFSAVTNRYRLRRRENAAQTAGDGKRACSTGRTTVR